MGFDDPYKILGLTPEATDEEVKTAYEKLAADEEKKEDAKAAFDQITEGKKKVTPAETSEEKADEKPEAPSEEKTEENSEETSAEKTEEESEKTSEEKKEEPEEKETDSKAEQKKATPAQMAMGIVTIILLAAILVALIFNALGQRQPQDGQAATEASVPAETAETVPATVPADGNPDDETCKGTYTGTDEEVVAAADNVVATMEGYELRNAQLQIYYWMGIQSYIQNSGPYIQFMGLDMSKPLDVQPCPLVEGQTWQQFFVKQAITSWQNYQGMAAEAAAAGHVMDPELEKFLKELPGQIEQQAKDNGFADGKEMLANNVGAGASMEDYLNFMQTYNEGFGYFQDTLAAAAPEAAAVEEYMTAHEAELLEQGISRDNKVASVRHILISPEDPESDEKWAEAEKKAQDLLAQYQAGSKTEDDFAKLATENTMDPGSQATGGLYEDFPKGQMVPEFEQWSFDETRKAGDTGIVKTDYGFHIMYFVGTRTVWQDQVSQIILQNTAEELIASISKKYPMTVDYSQILIGNLQEQEVAE